MTARITFHGISTYTAEGRNGRVLFDPFLAGNPVADVTEDEIGAPDVIVISHAAWDHMSSAAAIARRTGCAVVCGSDTAELLLEAGLPDAQIRRTTNGIRVQVEGVVVSPVFSAHWSQAKLADGRLVSGVPMAFVVEIEAGVRVYHFGDSAITSEMTLIGQLHAPTVGLLGVTQPWSLVGPGAGRVVSGEMSPDEAARAAEMLGVRFAVATHYEESEHPDVQAFLERVPTYDSSGIRVPLALRPGESLVIDGDDWSVTP